MFCLELVHCSECMLHVNAESRCKLCTIRAEQGQRAKESWTVLGWVPRSLQMFHLAMLVNLVEYLPAGEE